MKIKNLTIYLDDRSEIERLNDEYVSIGYYTVKLKDKLVVFALNPRLKTRKQRNKDKKKMQTMRKIQRRAPW